MEIGTFMPKGEIFRGRYVGKNKHLEGLTCLMADNGDWWSVQVDASPENLMVYGWWKQPKRDWTRVYTVSEAIATIADGKLWARPVWWCKSGIAIHAYNQTRLAVVPSATGGAAWNVAVRDLTDDWEVVDPNIVLDEV